MGNVLYLDCVSGISGDMTLAALIDLGADITYIESHLKQLPIDPFVMNVSSVVKSGIAAKKLHLHFHQNSHEHHLGGVHFRMEDTADHVHRGAADILTMIEESELPVRVKQRSLAIFQAIAEAEGKIHGMDPREVHFHEVGAMDSIIDIIGVCLALESLSIDRVYASPVPTGSGKVRMAHGLYPIPAPATAELLQGIPLADLDVKGELTTPTGAGILKTLVKEFRPIGGFTIQRIGYGAGEKNFDHPNVLRALLIQQSVEGEREQVVVVETQIDDMTGEGLGYVMERLFQSGALDVFYAPIYMKKNRPGTLVTVLVSFGKASDCEEILLVETSTLGVRRSTWSRQILERRFTTVETKFGSIRVKQAIREGRVLHQAPEYEDVAKAARVHGVPFQKVYEQVFCELNI